MNEIPNFILAILNGIVELCLKEYFSFSIKIVIVSIFFFLGFFTYRWLINNLCEKDFTIDGEQNIKVKRKNLIYKNDFFVRIKNKNLLPGDILFF